MDGCLLTLMVSACGGNGGNEAGNAGSERPEAFYEMFAHVEEYYRVSAEQGRQAADAMDMEFWKEHQLGSLMFNVAVEDNYIWATGWNKTGTPTEYN